MPWLTFEQRGPLWGRSSLKNMCKDMETLLNMVLMSTWGLWNTRKLQCRNRNTPHGRHCEQLLYSSWDTYTSYAIRTKEKPQCASRSQRGWGGEWMLAWLGVGWNMLLCAKSQNWLIWEREQIPNRWTWGHNKDLTSVSLMGLCVVDRKCHRWTAKCF